MAVKNNYRSIGIKLTPQRLAILSYLEGNTRHPSADDIFKAVSKKFPTMSLATVYSTLGALRERRSVIELTIDPDKKRYDPDIVRHNHLICISCKLIVDIPAADCVDLPETIKQDFSVMESHVEFYGLCPKCKKQNPEN